MNRNLLAAILASLAVVAVVVLGFRQMGGPATQRMQQTDRRSVQDLEWIARHLAEQWRDGKTIAPNLDAIKGAQRKNPISGSLYRYRPKAGSEYELCASFLLENHDGDSNGNGENFWAHPKGDYCFALDASQTPPNAPNYY